MEGADTQAIFTPACSSCHIDNGINKKHEELYQAVCAMCHPTAKFNSREDFLIENNTKIINLDLNECKSMMSSFIERNEKLWYEDISI